ncbi:DUF6599 family protein [Candidatus Latescibacterota bacterium]
MKYDTTSALSGFFLMTLILVVTAVPVVADDTQYLKESMGDGFSRKEPVRLYDQGNLYEYINGQAVFYISYGFTRLEHGVYTKGDKEYTVDVYELASRLSAFGAYRQQRDSDAGPIDAGVEGSSIDYLTVFYKGKHYVEIIPTGSEGEDVATMTLLAARIADVLPGETDLPPEVGLLPDGGLIENSGRYVDENLLSYAVMGRGLTANYNQGGDSELRVFLALPDDVETARKVYDGLLAKIKDSSLAKLEKAEGITGTTPYRGKAIMYIRDRFVFGCLSVKNEDQARKVLEALYGNLKKKYMID